MQLLSTDVEKSVQSSRHAFPRRARTESVLLKEEEGKEQDCTVCLSRMGRCH